MKKILKTNNLQNVQQNPHTGCGNFRVKKGLGQNFLKSEIALSTMCSASDLVKGAVVVEIGPGKGALTKKLLEKVDKVIAIEKDEELMPILEEKFSKEIESGKLILVCDDILAFEPVKYGLKKGNYKIVANIPYNITGLIIKRFLSETTRPESMTLLVQKEVAHRICAQSANGKNGKESILSLSVKLYATPKYIMKVSKKYFSPSPKVDSAIVTIKKITTPSALSGGESGEKLFFEIIKAGFAHKRKYLSNNLESIVDKNKINEAFKLLNLDSKLRAEDLSFDKWLELVQNLKENL